jgi:hypothetical protein
MARATFEGPILSGDNRFGPFRNVGYSQLVQNTDLDVSNTTVATPTYGGSSGQFVNSNGIPNSNATIYQPSASVYPSVVQTIPADSATNIYRGAVFYVPTGADLDNIYIDVLGLAAVAGGTAAITSQTVYVSNNYTAAAGTAAYFATGAISATGRQALATFTATQMGNQSATSTDILQANGQPNISQVVVTIAIVGTALDTRTSLTGKYNFTLQYSQPDNNIGTRTAYPYGNFD